MKIQAAVLYETNTPFMIDTLDLEPPRAGEVRVRIAAAGVCHSDWHLRTGATRHPLPVVAGHEGAGVVEEVGEGVVTVKPGEHVALNWAPACGTCFYCQNERPNLCSAYAEPIWAGAMMDGTTRLAKDGRPYFHYSALACFADHAVVPEESCVAVPKALPLPLAALIGCAVTTGMGAVLNTAQVPPGSTVAVFGAGGVGLSIVIGAKLAGAARIIAVDRVPGKSDIAGHVGATDFLPAGPKIPAEIQDLTEGRGADYVFETTGIPEVQEQCFHAARPGGTVVLAGLAPMDSTMRLSGALLTRQEKTVMGTYYGTANPARDFPSYANLHLEKKIDLTALISRTYSLGEINEAFEAMLAGELARGVIVFPPPAA